LEGLHPSAIVGYAGKECGCPIAGFIKALGFNVVSVGFDCEGDLLYAHGGDECELLPDWAFKFVVGVDEGESGYPLNARECLSILPSEAPSA
jgi:hypothetical protein